MTIYDDYMGPVGYGREKENETGRRVRGNVAKNGRKEGSKREVSRCVDRCLAIFLKKKKKIRVRRAETLLQIKRREEVHKSIDI